MKKTLLLSVACCATALAAMAGTRANLINAPQNHTPLRADLANNLSKFFSNGTRNAAKAQKKATSEQPVTATPAGTAYENMYVTSNAYGLGFGSAYYQAVDGGLGGVVEGSDGYVYVQAPISQAYVWSLGSPWLKCTKLSGDTIEMATPQLYAIDYGDPYYAQRMKLTADSSSFEVDSVNTTVKFVWKDHKLTQVDDCLVGLCDATGEWFYMGDYDITYTVNPDTVVAVPSSAVKASYKLDYIPKATNLDSTTNTITSIHIDPNNPVQPYVTDLCTDLPDNAVKAQLSSDGKFLLPTRQYIGIDKMYNAHVYVLTGDAKVDSTSSSVYFNYDQTSAAEFKVNANGDSIVSSYPTSVIVNCGRSNLYIIQEFVAPVLSQVEDKAIVPADPTLSVREATKFDMLSIVIPTVGANGEDLNTKNLYYNIYYNDSVYTFTPSLYVGLESDLTDIPYSYSDQNYDIYTSSTGKTTIYFYDKNYTKIGVQSIYRGGGVENRSNVVYYDKQSGIDGIESTKTVKATECYDVAGRKTSESASGLVIKRITYTDGSVEVVKTCNR